MTGLLHALTVVKSALAIAALSVSLTLAGAGTATPAAPGSQPTPAASPKSADVATILAANEARLLDVLETVAKKLEANPNVNEHAKAALEKLIAKIESGKSGLDRAAAAIAGDHAAPSLPPQAADHPTATDHPEPSLPAPAASHPIPTLPAPAANHPTSTDHPGRP